MASPSITCDPAQGTFQVIVDEGQWRDCPNLKCDVSWVALGGHFIRGRTIVDGVESPGNAYLFLYKKHWQDWDLYYVIKLEGGAVTWELQAIK
jgi:hypothetical protein